MRVHLAPGLMLFDAVAATAPESIDGLVREREGDIETERERERDKETR